MPSPVSAVAPGVFRVADVCNVYVVVADEDAAGQRTAFSVDFGSGLVLDHLAELGVDRLTDVLMTHHHRDQGQGLPRAVEAGIRVHVPPVEQDLFSKVDEFWRTRPLENDYVVRQDRFSLLEPVPAHGVVPEYRTATYAGTEVEVVPTPGHTTGSVTYVVERAGQRLAFVGDLIYAPGKVWSLAATQWTYSGVEGPGMTVLSCYQLLERELDLLLPSHGDVLDDPRAALELLAGRMRHYVDARLPKPWDLRSRLAEPYVALTEHLLHNTTSEAKSYVLVSRDGAALLFDYGYDMITGLPTNAGADRASRRPWLASLPALKRRHGVQRIEIALPTHYHDDHVAAMNLLREAEGTQVWVPENMADVLARPADHDLPALWYDPIPADRRLPLGRTFTWHEYEITVHDLPGHTLFAVAYEFEVDGVKVLVTGDQQDGSGVPGERRELLNYQYRNRFRIGDFQQSAALYRKLAPDLMVSGHWAPRWVDEPYLELLETAGDEVAQLHRDLLPLDEFDLGTDGVVARIEPYHAAAAAGSVARLRVIVRNPYPVDQPAVLRLVTPVGWRATPEPAEVHLPAAGTLVVEMEAVVRGPAVRRARVAVDLTVGELRLGQHAEALVDVIEPADE
ncbi:MAG TPA: MBL fold metallo-hydrolase [Jatrophihabitans sp.]|nr:MBL fold metallo-hydrolase [Jatrophihabitans sp.]